MKRSLYLLTSLLVIILAAAAGDDDKEKSPFETGRKLFGQGRYAEALTEYMKAEKADPVDPLAKYNSLTCLLADHRLEQAERKLTAEFDKFGGAAGTRAKAAYNLGTAHLKRAEEAKSQGQQAETSIGDLQKAVSWLERSLLDDHTDIDAKNNLELARKLLEKMQKEQQEQDDQQNQDKQGQDQSEQGGDQQQQKGGEQQEQEKEGQQEQKEGQNRESQQDEKQQEHQDRQQQQQQQARQQEKDEGDRDKQERAIPPDVARNLLKAARQAELQALKQMRERMDDGTRKRRQGKVW